MRTEAKKTLDTTTPIPTTTHTPTFRQRLRARLSATSEFLSGDRPFVIPIDD